EADCSHSAQRRRARQLYDACAPRRNPHLSSSVAELLVATDALNGNSHRDFLENRAVGTVPPPDDRPFRIVALFQIRGTARSRPAHLLTPEQQALTQKVAIEAARALLI